MFLNGYKYILFFIFSLLIFTSGALQAQPNNKDTLLITYPEKDFWVDSVLQSLSLQEKIAQLVMLRANYPGEEYMEEITDLIEDYNIGGLTFFGATPSRQLKQTNYWQSIAKTPLLISIDGEWGVGMRLDSVLSFPFQMTLGAISGDSLIYQMGEQVAAQCRRMGIHLNFAPVVDVNVNPKNPVINMRSFGENPAHVAAKGLAYMKGLQDHGIIATAKHFPGHGDTETDSHHTLPVVSHNYQRLDSIELAPFKTLIDSGLKAMMIAHLYLPVIEKEENTATTLSKDVVQGVLKDSLGFEGLIITDALDMKGVTKYFPPGEIEVRALRAGNDILLLPLDAEKAIASIIEQVRQGNIQEKLIEKKCRKIIATKYDAGLYHQELLKSDNILDELNTDENFVLNHELYARALTLIKNKNTLIPILRPDTMKIASLIIGTGKAHPFEDYLDRYSEIRHFRTGKQPGKRKTDRLVQELKQFDLIIIGLSNTNILARDNFGISPESIQLIHQISRNNKTILNLFGNPYAIGLFNYTLNMGSILVAYQDNAFSWDISAQLIFGGTGARGKLPVSADALYPAGSGIDTKKQRLGYTLPAKFGITKAEISKIDSIALSGIREKAYPGCQVIAAKDGEIFYEKVFGYHTYDSIKPTHINDIYDLASITKIAATTLSIMKLAEEGRIDIDNKLEVYLPYLRGTGKGDIVIRELMAHQAGLTAWIPYYTSTLDDEGQPKAEIYSREISEDYPVRVAEDLYIRKDFAHTIFDSILMSHPREYHDYKYSDLGFYFLYKIVENATNEPFEKYVSENFYQRLGLKHMGFHPRKSFKVEQIAPTEQDQYFRQQLLQGDVHDPGAAMLGGVSGHAGLFSNAGDLAQIMQLLLQKGHYLGKSIFDTSSIKEFTSCQFPVNLNRRGIGFDKPLLIYEKDGPACKSASPESFGHSGFTGTYTWADPENNLVYVFLSNRVYPDASNNKISELNIRTNLHQAFYDALGN